MMVLALVPYGRCAVNATQFIRSAALPIFTLRVGLHAVRDEMPMRRQAMMLLTVLSSVGVLQMAVPGLPVHLPFWQWFLAAHGY